MREVKSFLHTFSPPPVAKGDASDMPEIRVPRTGGRPVAGVARAGCRTRLGDDAPEPPFLDRWSANEYGKNGGQDYWIRWLRRMADQFLIFFTLSTAGFSVTGKPLTICAFSINN